MSTTRVTARIEPSVMMTIVLVGRGVVFDKSARKV